MLLIVAAAVEVAVGLAWHTPESLAVVVVAAVYAVVGYDANGRRSVVCLSQCPKRAGGNTSMLLLEHLLFCTLYFIEFLKLVFLIIYI